MPVRFSSARSPPAGTQHALDARSHPRNPVFTIHDQKAMLAQRVIALALGYEDLNDHQTLRTDPRPSRIKAD